MAHSNSAAIGKSSGAGKAEQASTISKSANGRQRTNTQQVHNVLLIWLDKNIDNNNKDCRNTVSQLRHVVHNIITYTDSDQCVEFIRTITNNKICMIISGALGQHTVPYVHKISQVDSIFIFCGNKTHHEQWAKEWPKIKGVFTEISPICEALKQAAQRCERNAIPISFVAKNTGDTSNETLDRLDPSFMYTQILKEILLTIKFEQQHIKKFVDYCREQFVNNEEKLTNVQKLERNYRDKTPIYWYTSESFLYPMLNRALRVMNADVIVQMGFFIDDLHRHIEKLHSKQFGGHSSGQSFTVYRGQGLSNADFDRLIKTKGGLLSFNNFLSTSTNRQVSLHFAKKEPRNPDSVGILFIMKIDPAQSTTPFAAVHDDSFFHEEDEVLFSMHTIFRINDIKSMDGSNRLFEVNLALTSDNDPDLRVLTDRIRKETFPNSEGWYRLGLVLLKVGQSEKAQEVYEVLLDQTTNEREKAPIYNQLGWVKSNRGEYQEAITFYEEALAIQQQSLPPNHPDLAMCYNNIGAVSYGMGNYPKALLSHEKALAIRQQSLPPNHSHLAMSYNNIGLVSYSMGDYSKALSLHEKALAVGKQSLPPNHPDLAMSYNNIGLVYTTMGVYSKGLSSHEKALAIRQQSLPPNHPDLAFSYMGICVVYKNMGDYLKALLSHEKAVAIQQQSLPPDHPHLAMSYNSIGLVYASMGGYSKALSSHKKALTIRKQSLPPNHPDLAASYMGIGDAYDSMGDYPKALSSHEKGLAIRQQKLPPNHPDLASSYMGIGVVYKNMGDYPKALSSYEKALAIQKQSSLPPNHPDLAISNNNIGLVYDSMGDYPKALSSHGKALTIQKQSSLPPNHPDLASSYMGIGVVYKNMGDYPKALLSHGKALAIRQQSLPPNHPDLASSYMGIGNVYKNISDYPKALSSHGKALAIRQQSLPPNHPDLASSYYNIGWYMRILSTTRNHIPVMNVL